MPKPLFRWIVGDVNPQGLLVFSQTIRNLIKLYKNYFDFLICSNAIDPICIIKIKEISERFGVEIYKQSWDSFPLNKETVLENFNIFSKTGIPRGRQGTFWKICPPRLRIGSHEIICDNDLIITKKIDSIFQFLENNKVLMLKEDAFCVGKYFHMFKEGENYNSGLYGLPPNYDFANDLKCSWEKNGKFNNLFWRDEQGLITMTLKKNKHITITSDEIIHLFSGGRCSDYEFEFITENLIKTRVLKNLKIDKFNFSNKDKGYHFLGVNRDEHHATWHQYKNQGILYG
jgi:hypothetical protein